MTIENLIQRHIDRIALLSHFRRTAHLGRRRQESAAARRVLRRLIAVLDDMLGYERDALAVHRLYLARTSEAERAQDEHAEPGWCEFEGTFCEDFSDVALLDPEPVHEAGHALDPSTRTWLAVDDGYPASIRLTEAELGDLAVLIAAMKRGLGIEMTAERVFWTEDALFDFVCALEEREARAGLLQ